MFRIITTVMLICALAISACDDKKEKSVEDCQEAPVAAVEVEDNDAGLPEECEGDDCPPVEEECIEDCEEEPEPEPAGVEPVEEPVEECPEEGCEEPAPAGEEEPAAGEEAPEVDPPIPG